MTACEDLAVKANAASLNLSSFDREVNTTIDITCSESNRRLVGASQLTCLASGQWDNCLPTCIADFSEREIVILAVTCSIILILLVVLVTIVIAAVRKRAKVKKKRSDRLAQTLERLSIRDPLDELVRRESRRSSFGYMNDSLNNIPAVNGDVTKRRLYKIWNAERNRKTFAFADDLQELIERGREKLDLKGDILAVLEEDGTEIDNDDILHACAGKVLILKAVNETWRNSRIITTHETLPPDTTRF